MIRYLGWDSDNFGIKVGRVDLDTFSTEDYFHICAEAKSQDYDLIYVVGPQINPDLYNDAFYLVDEKVIYETQVMGDRDSCPEVFKLPATVDYRELLDLAYESGKYSRYKTDVNMPVHVFKSLYSRWIENAVNRVNDQQVLVLKRDERYVGMLTYQPEENNCYTIGLVAVSPAYAGKGIGTALMQAFFRVTGKDACVEVATQRCNRTACHYYEKNGFAIKAVTPISHLWIK